MPDILLANDLHLAGGPIEYPGKTPPTWADSANP